MDWTNACVFVLYRIYSSLCLLLTSLELCLPYSHDRFTENDEKMEITLGLCTGHIWNTTREYI